MATKKPPWKDLISRDDLGGLLHTSLRKCCDSSPTSLAWNAIYALDEPWKRYLDRAYPLVLEAKSKEDVIEALQKAANWRSGDFGKLSHADLTLLLIFESFSDLDWHGFVYYLTE